MEKKSNWKRTSVGQVLKSKQEDRDGNALPEGEYKRPYIKLTAYAAKHLMERLAGLDATKPKDCIYLQLEDKALQVKSVNDLAARGILKGEALEKAKERVERIPDFVLFDIVDIQKVSE